MSKPIKRDELDWSLVAQNIRLWRQAQSITQADLAVRSGVTESTISHAERGHPVSMRTLKKIAKGLDIQLSGVCFDRRVIPAKDQPYVIHRGERVVWSALGDKRKHDNIDRQRFELDEAERKRIAMVGFVSGFMHTPQFVMPDGPGVVFIELYGPFVGKFNHTLYKDAILFCMEGKASLTIQDRTEVLAQGDAMGLISSHVTRLEPAADLTPEQLPVKLLWVGANRLGKVPDAAKKGKSSSRARPSKGTSKTE